MCVGDEKQSADLTSKKTFIFINSLEEEPVPHTTVSIKFVKGSSAPNHKSK